MKERLDPTLSIGRGLHVILSLDPRVLKRALNNQGQFSTPDIVVEALESIRCHASKPKLSTRDGPVDPLLASLAEHVLAARSRHILGLLTWVIAQPGCASFARRISSLFETHDKRQLLSACIIARHVAEVFVTRGCAEHIDSSDAHLSTRAVIVSELPSWVCSAVTVAGDPGGWKPTRLCCTAFDCAVACILCLADTVAPPVLLKSSIGYVCEDRAMPSLEVSASRTSYHPIDTCITSRAVDDTKHKGLGMEASDNGWLRECASTLRHLKPQLEILLMGWARLTKSDTAHDELAATAELASLGAETAAGLLADILHEFHTDRGCTDSEPLEATPAGVLAQCWANLGTAMLLDTGKWATLLHTREAEWSYWMAHGPPPSQAIISSLADPTCGQNARDCTNAANQYNILVGSAVAIMASQLPQRNAETLACTVLSSGAKGLLSCFGSTNGSESSWSRIGAALVRWLLAQGSFPPPVASGPEDGVPLEKRQGINVQEGDTSAALVVLPGIMDLLAETGGVSAPVFTLAAELLLRLRATKVEFQWWRGPAVLGYEPISSLIQSDKASARLNGISLLHALADLRLPSTVDDLDESELVPVLVRLLVDNSIPVRKESARLLARLPQDAALYPLVNGVADKDARTRSAAAEGFHQVLRSASSEQDAFAVLLCALEVAQELSDGSSVADVNGNSSSKTIRSRAERARDELQRTATRWAVDDLDAKQRLAAAHCLTSHLMTHPGNLNAVTLLSAWSSWLSSGPALDLVLGACVEELRRQPLEPSLSHISPGKELIERLGPLLLLKVLLLGALDNLRNPNIYAAEQYVVMRTDCKEANVLEPQMGIAGFLFHRLQSSQEYEEVRLLSAELAGRLQPDYLGFHTDQLLCQAVSVGNHNYNLKAIRALCFVMCSMISARGQIVPWAKTITRKSCQPASGDLLEDCDAAISSGIAGHLLNVLRWEGANELGATELRKTHMGAMECLALMCRAELVCTKPISAGPMIKNMNTDGVRGATQVENAGVTEKSSGICMTTLDLILEALLEGAAPAEEQPQDVQLQICMANVLIMLSQRLEPPMLPGYEANIMQPVTRAVTRMLATSTMHNYQPLLVPCLQVLFTSTHTMAAARFPDFDCKPLMQLALLAMEGANADDVRMAGAKLLAALLTLPEDTLKFASEIIHRARVLVRSAAALDRSSELRQLCAKLSACLG